MANDAKISVVLTADAGGAITGIRSVGDATEGLASRTQSVTQRFKVNWLGAAAGITAAYLALQKMWDLMDEAARLSEKMDNLNNLTAAYGTTAEGLVGTIQANSRGLIDLATAASVATDAISKGFSPGQVAQMAKYAETLAETSGEAMSTSQAFKTMEESIVSARERGMVKMFGASMDLATSLGETFNTMSKGEKAQAAFNLAMELGEKRAKALGENVDSAADRMERFTNSMTQAKFFLGQLLLVLGQPLMAVFNAALMMVFGLVSGFWNVASSFAMITDQLGITSGKGEQYAKKADEWVTRAANQAVMIKDNLTGALDALKNFGSLTSGVGKGGLPATLGSAGENQKHAQALEEIYRGYLKEIDLLTVAEIDKERVQAEEWLKDQTAKLKKASATDREYGAAREVYQLKVGKAEMERATQIADFYIAEQKRSADESEKIEQDRIAASIKEQIDAANMKLEAQLAAAAASQRSESEIIRLKAEGARTDLALRQQALIASITENTTWQETLAIMQQVRDIDNEIARSKGVEVADLDARRIVVEREITELIRKQRDLLFEQQTARTQEAFGKIGGSEFGQNLVVVSAINAGEDPYTKDFERWSVLQDQKIMYLEEIGGKEAEIKDAYREYDLQQEATAQAQKVAMTSATFGMLGSLATSLYNMQRQKGGAAFEIMKAFRIGETIMNTYSAAVGAYNAMAAIPVVGPALGAAAAVAAIAFGMAQVSAISSMKPGGGAASQSISAGGIGGGAGAGSSGGVPATSTEPVRSPTVNIHIYGNVVDHDKFAREIVPAITKAMGDGVA